MSRWPLRVVPVLLLLVSLGLVVGRKGETIPLYAAREGLMCQSCHFDPNGGGPRNEFGFAYARNRHSLTPEDTTSQWNGLSIGNRVGENVPLFFGVNQRFMLLTNQNKGQDSLARLGFFNMENAIHLVFQPHQRLTLLYSFDAFSSSATGNPVRSKDAFGMISGFPLDGYVKIGRFRNPFGLRLDDHTVATRAGFLDLTTDERVLPYDPRIPDMGVEIGADRAGAFGRMTFTNGPADPFAGEFAQATSLKLGYNTHWYQGGVSLYDNFNKVGSSIKRQDRWGYYGLTHWNRAVLLGEVVAGTDEAEPPFGFASGQKTNSLAGYVEGDYSPCRSWNMRLRWDREVLDRTDNFTRAATSHARYSLETEWVPVPFAELRFSLRRIHHENEVAFGFPDETQTFLQFHFSY